AIRTGQDTPSLDNTALQTERLFEIHKQIAEIEAVAGGVTRKTIELEAEARELERSIKQSIANDAVSSILDIWTDFHHQEGYIEKFNSLVLQSGNALEAMGMSVNDVQGFLQDLMQIWQN